MCIRDSECIQYYIDENGSFAIVDFDDQYQDDPGDPDYGEDYTVCELKFYSPGCLDYTEGICNFSEFGECVDDCGGDDDTPPEGFTFNSSTQQAGYFFLSVTINEELVDSNDWVGAFNGDVCVGSRKWDLSECNNQVCEVPVMGYDGSIYSEGYMLPGQVPTFKIFDASENAVYDAVSSEDNPWSNLGLYLIDNAPN